MVRLSALAWRCQVHAFLDFLLEGACGLLEFVQEFVALAFFFFFFPFFFLFFLGGLLGVVFLVLLQC